MAPEIEKTQELASDELQMRAGTDFFAHGQKPTWTLELDYEGDLVFSTRDGDYLQCPMPEGIETLEGRVVRYHASTDAGLLDVTIEETQCFDPITGLEMGYIVVVEFINSKDEAMPAWEGCGTLAGGSAVVGTWTFAAIDGESVKPGPKGKPDITFNLKTNQISGSGGCNRYSSTVKVNENQLTIGLIAATKMACDNLDSESKLFQRLTNGTFHFHVNGMMMTMSNSAGEIVLEKTLK